MSARKFDKEDPIQMMAVVIPSRLVARLDREAALQTLAMGERVTRSDLIRKYCDQGSLADAKGTDE